MQVAVFDADGSARWADSTEEAGIGLFRGIEQLGVDLSAMRAFVFCEGPGSVLGVRTSAMALRTWNVLTPRPCFSYMSLALLAAAESETAIADARRDSWHVMVPGAALRRLTTAEFGDRACVTPAEFRHWTPLPTSARAVPYDLATLLPRVAELDLFRASEAPDAFLHEEPSYVTWTPSVHRAPTP